MSAIEAKLNRHGFARIHRSTIVNLNEILEMAALTNGEYLVTLKAGAKLKWSRNYRAALEQLLRK
jgi:two-component system LytT family response regulator